MTTPNLRAVGLVPHRVRGVAHELAGAAARFFLEHGVEVRVPDLEAKASGLGELGVTSEGFVAGLDLVISLGGDGTMLHAVDLVYPAPVPILGVNVGQLGYLTEVEPDELDASLPRLLAGDFDVSERMVLAVHVVSSGAATGTWFALNEAALEKQRNGHLIRLDVSINGSPFTTYAADGVIVATPTGTTAYSFSVRGPIASPALRCLVLTPVSPHMLFDRSLVLADSEELGFVMCDDQGVVLTLDGRELGQLGAGDRVSCVAAAEPLRLASLRARDFHQVLKAKFALPDR
ncbi:MAG: kinase [Actinomycetota bacterium]|nr:kinase [Actinomycetota bacterium]